MDFKQQWIALIHQMQDDICSQIEDVDGLAKFEEDNWEREGGGGGKTRVIANGNVFEKGGVNTSVVYGDITDAMRKQLNVEGDKWFAAGISSVIHPVNPFVPTVHFNYRMFEIYNADGEVIDTWFGGGTDLTPYYLFEEDAVNFHQALKSACDQLDISFYPKFKLQCDNYFVNIHRNNERRGIGGIFYDHEKPNDQTPQQFWYELAKSCGYSFKKAYLSIAEKRKDTPYEQQHIDWQEIRRGRYVEFNLIHDRGTIFGLKSNGRVESILMSLPPRAQFKYNYQPPVNSKEFELLDACLHPKNWI